MKHKRFQSLFIIIGLIFLSINQLYCQETNSGDWIISLGIETGVSLNRAEERINKLFGDLPKENRSGYIGVTSNLEPVSSYFSITTGMRIQLKNIKNLKLKYVSLPLQLNVFFIKSKKTDIGLVAGSALEMNLSSEGSSNLEVNKFALNWRFGFTITQRIEHNLAIRFQFLRTIGSKSYLGYSSSQSGRTEDMYYKNSGIEFGFNLIRYISH